MQARQASAKPASRIPGEGQLTAQDYPAVVALGLYALVSVMFTGIYLQMTTRWPGAALAAYTKGELLSGMPPIFRLRVLMPFIAFMLLMAIVDEVRCYMEMIPVVLTSVAYAISLRLRTDEHERFP